MRAALIAVALLLTAAAPAAAAPALVSLGNFSRRCTSPRRRTTRACSWSSGPAW